MSTGKSFHGGRVPWSSERAAARGIHVPLLRPKIGQQLIVIAVGEHVLGADLHYDGANTVPCIGQDLACRQCAEGRSYRRSWFLQVLTIPTTKLGILCITNGALERCPALYPEMPSVRGHYVKAWRTGNVINGPMHVSLGKKAEGVHLPTGIDMQAQLLKIWGFDPPATRPDC